MTAAAATGKIESPAAAPAATPARAPSKARRALRYLAYGVAASIVAAQAASIAWKMSGSTVWKLEVDRDGVQVYSLKPPGSSGKQFRTVTQAKYSLNQLVGGLIENSTLDVCKREIEGCVDLQVISPWNAKTLSDTVLWKLALPPPFSPREVVLRSQVTQDPVTKAVTVDLIGAPNSTPRHNGSIRLTHVQNRWRYTPLGHGEVRIEFLQDMDLGDLFPNLLINLAGADAAHAFVHDRLPRLLANERVQNARYAFIEELP